MGKIKIPKAVKKAIVGQLKKQGKRVVVEVLKDVLPGGHLKDKAIDVLASKKGQNVIKAISGKGDYVIHSNSISTKSEVTEGSDLVPSFKSGDRTTTVRHREYIGDLYSSPTSGGFQNTSYAINPGNLTAFPWLSVIAQNFDQWRPNGIVICFKSTSANWNGTNQQLGTVIMASDYDLTDPAYSSKIEMENTEFAVSGRSCDSILHPLECNPDERQVKILKCRGITNPTDNKQWYDLCNFQIATFGVTGESVNLGEIWITYDITFYKEQLNGNLFGNALLQLSGQSPGATATTTNYFGTNFAVYGYSTLQAQLTDNDIIFPNNVGAGSYAIMLRWSGTSTACTSPSIAYTSNSKYGPTFWGTYANFITPTTTTDFVSIYSVTLTGPGAVVTFSGGTLPATSTARVSIIQLNSNVNY